jgi:hypothetical protein
MGLLVNSPGSPHAPSCPRGNAPSILNKDYTISANVNVPKRGADGLIVTMGGPQFIFNCRFAKAVVGERAAGWLESEVRDWLATRIETSRGNQRGNN